MSRRYHNLRPFAFAAVCVSLVALACGAARITKSKMVGLGGNVNTTVTKSVSQPGFYNAGGYTFSGIEGTACEMTLSSGTSQLVTNAVVASKLQVFYAQFDSTSGTINFYSTTSGTDAGVGTAITVTPGVLYEWDCYPATSGGTSSVMPAGGNNWNSFRVTTGTEATSTNVHVHTSISQ